MNRKSPSLLLFLVLFIIAGIGGAYKIALRNRSNMDTAMTASVSGVSSSNTDQGPAKLTPPIITRLDEAGSMEESTDPFWWLNSGAYVFKEGTIMRTITGDLAENDPRRIRYAQENPGETDNGYHPQNIFRLVTRGMWQESTQQVYFDITHYYTSTDVHRDASNGVLLFNRYQDGDNLYYTGLRVDGSAVIKKKIGGTYYTMAIKQLFFGSYNRSENPNLLPVNTWIGIKSDIQTLDDGEVSIKLYIDQNNTGVWKLAAEATDNNKSYGGAAITKPGFAGLRSDFMDVQFDRYAVQENK